MRRVRERPRSSRAPEAGEVNRGERALTVIMWLAVAAWLLALAYGTYANL
jgi:hypothetical protein